MLSVETRIHTYNTQTVQNPSENNHLSGVRWEKLQVTGREVGGGGLSGWKVLRRALLEYWVLYVSDESLTPTETNSTLYVS